MVRKSGFAVAITGRGPLRKPPDGRVKSLLGACSLDETQPCDKKQRSNDNFDISEST